jgi:biopolymer transport protein ExbD
MAMQFRKESSNLKPLTLFSQSSLTDIILLLLIFFLLTSSFVSNYGIQVNIPSASTASAGETQQITVSITDEGRYFLDGNEIDQSVLGAELRVALEGKDNPILVIRADRQSKLEESVYVMNLGKALDLPLVIAADRQFN